MPDNPTELNPQGSIRDKLASLDSEFNTNSGFGFMGMLNANEEKAKQLGQTKEVPDPTPPEEPNPGDGSPTPPEWIAPLNTSIQVARSQFDQGFNELRSEIQQLKHSRDAGLPAQEESNLPPEIQPIAQQVDGIGRSINTLAIRQEFQRAKDSLRDAKQRYKEFNYPEEEFTNVFNKFTRGNPNLAASTDWDNYFRTQYESQINPKLMSENEKLKQEIDKYRSGRASNASDLAAVPRSNRQVATSPSTSNSNSDFDEDLYQRAKARVPKGRFIGFQRALVEEQNRKSFATA